ncbi:SusC/RagA family TonB-linked outer membrane protein [Cecembia rubra]|uniref:TonB-linked SusC/RagA family outer membrane protein n=1 Tax=Cecembia rubra TaxID=1485585 RepID=A0A2P8DYF4_9BACT|nr:SusC/RagA family TonB-linked outer membrane protein [Cecembia rubra]PSL02258.1 TonB-linked SusC/RagA family outer membrane protein [Cecembia rubra]
MKKGLLTLMLCLLSMLIHAQEQNQSPIRGKVIGASDGLPLPGAVIKENKGQASAITDENGNFSIRPLSSNSDALIISFIGFKRKEVSLEDLKAESESLIRLFEEGLSLGEVEIFSTGYQDIPKERATGSFVQVDNELINRRVSTNLIDRLEDVTSGLIFNRGPSAVNDPISIRGRSTIFAETQPLIIIDNFPYDGPLENINPNDVESITVLRDAAAASIWGARSGNGVIVIKTKAGGFNQKMNVTLNSNTNFLQKPDLMASPQMSISDFISIEEMLFGRGFYNSRFNDNVRSALSPAVETLYAHREGLISTTEKDQLMARYAQTDSRRELLDHFYRTAVNQQHSLGINGGSQYHRYSFSVGKDINNGPLIGNSDQRTTLSFNNQWSLINDKLEIGALLYYTQASRYGDTEMPILGPYDRIFDENGLPAQVARDHSIRFANSFLETDFLDWRYFPAREKGILSNSRQQADTRINATVGYKLTSWLKAELLYQHWKNTASSRDYAPQESYGTRWLINRYTQVANDGTLSRPIPLGGILDTQHSLATGNYGRFQLSANKNIRNIHQIHAIAGAEVKDVQTVLSRTRYYGYDDNFGISLPVNYDMQFRVNPQNALFVIPRGEDNDGIVDRFISYFANASYTFDSRLVFSASARKDASNIFGVETNQRAVPLWSSGLAWNLSEERFYSSNLIPYLRLRATYGYNGNVDRTLSAFTTANYLIMGNNAINPGQRFALIRNPPNRNLRWERIRTVNLGLDLSLKDNMLDLSLEFFAKQGMDLIGEFAVAPSTGFSTFRGNFADTKSTGIDIILNARPLKSRKVWDINFLFSMVNEEVVAYDRPATVNNMLFTNIAPVVGRPLFSMFGMPWAGLDPSTGDPLGILNGEPSNNYLAIRQQTTPDDLVYLGPERPQIFGALRNTVHIGSFYVSANISYRLGYFFRKQTVDYSQLLNGRISHSDFHVRWQEPGDEDRTNVPSIPQVSNLHRQFLHTYSEAFVERGDHIRFQDIRLGYRLENKKSRNLPFKSGEIYAYANNLGILWKASKNMKDPDFQNIPPIRSLALGFRLDF